MKNLNFHLLVFILYIVGLYYDEFVMKFPIGSPTEKVHKAKGGKYKFLTYLNMLLQCGYYGLCLANDFVGSETKIVKQQSSIQKLRDLTFTTLVFPMGLFVSLIFWTLYAIDRELIFPASLDEWFPSWLNHVMHTLPAIAVLIEVFMVCHFYPNGGKRFLPIITAYILYLSWICYIAYVAGIWVYPVFEVLDITGRTLFFAALLFPNLFFVHLGQKIHLAVWGTDKERTKSKGKRE